MGPATRGGSPPVLSRGGERSAPTFSNGRPCHFAEQQYTGLLKGVGATCKEPICAKKSSFTKRVHDATHFAVGYQSWDEGSRGQSLSHAEFIDHGVIYTTCNAPDKNSSVVQLCTHQFEPAVHYKTEQRLRFEAPGVQAREVPYRARATIVLGDEPYDSKAFMPQSVESFCGKSQDAARLSSLASAGKGALIPNCVLPGPDRVNPIHGGPRSLDIFDVGLATRGRFNRLSANFSNIVVEPNVRNPILGVHVPIASMDTSNMRTTQQQVAEANISLPKLRSLGALRPGC